MNVMFDDCQTVAMRETMATTMGLEATVQRLTPETDRYGNHVLSAPMSVATVPCSMVRAGTREERTATIRGTTAATIDRDQQATDWICRLPAGTDINGHDWLVVGGVTYEVVGTPVEFPTHTHADVRHVSG